MSPTPNAPQTRRIRAIILLFAAAAAVLCIHLIILGQRSDSAVILPSAQAPILTADDRRDHTILVCDANPSELPEQISVITPASDAADDAPVMAHTLTLTPGRPLVLSEALAEKFSIDKNQTCSLTSTFNHHWDPVISIEDDAIRQTPVPETQGSASAFDAPLRNTDFIADLYSQEPPSGLDRLIFLIFLLTVGCAAAAASKLQIRRPALIIPDAPAGFVLAMLLAFALAEIFLLIPIERSEFLPGYGEFFFMLLANFLAFGGAAGIIFAVSRRRLSKSPQADSEAIAKPANPAFPIGLGFGLAVLAAGTMMFAPAPGLSSLELASQIVSAQYLTAYFAILAGICEECLFRGIIQGALMAGPASRYPRLRNAAAVAAATGVFVMMHVPQSMAHLWALAPIAAVSIASGLLLLRYRTIFPSILLHMTYNTALLMPSIFLTSSSL